MVRTRLLLPALFASLALASCGDSGDDDGAAAPAGGGTEAATGFPVSLADQFGTATIEAAPKRVVTVGFNEQDFALALGVKPVGVREFIGAFPYKTRPWAPGANDPAPALVGGAEIDFEKVAQARPDLILGIYSFIKKPDYEKLSQLAPTIANGKGYPDGATPWNEQLLTTGKALGLEAKAKEVVDGVNEKFAAAEKAHPEFAGKTLTIAYASAGQTFVLNKDDLRSQFFSDLGFTIPEKYSKSGFEENLSKEQLSTIDSDVIVLIQDKGTDLQAEQVFKNLAASREGRVVPVLSSGNFAGALGFNSPLSRPYLLDLAVPRLAAAVDGDPKTAVAPE